MNITICEFMALFSDPKNQKFVVWDNNLAGVVFDGYITDTLDILIDKLLNSDVTSVDNLSSGTNTICININ